jgi:hypothetical protein
VKRRALLFLELVVAACQFVVCAMSAFSNYWNGESVYDRIGYIVGAAVAVGFAVWAVRWYRGVKDEVTIPLPASIRRRTTNPPVD